MSIDYSSLKGTYTADSIGIETGMHAIAKQTAMYLGSRSFEGILQQFIEILDNSLDETEFVSKSQNTAMPIEIEFYEDGSVRVRDYGRGLPIGFKPEINKRAIEAIFELTSAGGKSYNVGMKGYQGTTVKGTHGAGAAVVAATSEFFNVKVTSLEDDNTYILGYANQQKVQPFKSIGHRNKTGFQYGTEIHWKYDPKLFNLSDGTRVLTYPFDMKRVIKIIEDRCYTSDNIVFKLKCNEPGAPPYEKIFNSSEYDLRELALKNIEGPHCEGTLEFDKHKLTLYCGMAKQVPVNTSYCNGMRMTQSSQNDVFVTEMYNILENLFKQAKILHKDYPLYFEPKKELTFILLLDTEDPEYNAQRKIEFRDRAFEIKLRKELPPFLYKNGKDFLAHLFGLKQEQYLQVVKQFTKTSQKKSQVIQVTRDEARHLKTLTHPKSPSIVSDIIISEGKSAAAALRTHLKPTQGLTYLGGLFPNVFTMSEERLKVSDHFKPLKEALSLHWNRIILLSDPDPVGGLIQLYVLSLLIKYYSTYIYTGKIYILKAPYYIAYEPGGCKYLYTEEQKEDYVKDNKTVTVERNKGLGSLSGRDLKHILDYDNPSTKDIDFYQIDPLTVKPGLRKLEAFLGKSTEYRKQIILQNFATSELEKYYAIRTDKHKLQKIKFDLLEDANKLERDIGYTGNLYSEDEYNTDFETLLNNDFF